MKWWIAWKRKRYAKKNWGYIVKLFRQNRKMILVGYHYYKG